MQMSGNEKQDNRFREFALVGMVIVMMVLSKDKLFVLYGLCAQTLLEALGKYCFVCRWLGKSPVRLFQYFAWWMLPVGAIWVIHLAGWRESFPAMIIACGCTFVLVALFLLNRERKGA